MTPAASPSVPRLLWTVVVHSCLPVTGYLAIILLLALPLLIPTLSGITLVGLAAPFGILLIAVILQAALPGNTHHLVISFMAYITSFTHVALAIGKSFSSSWIAMFLAERLLFHPVPMIKADALIASSIFGTSVRLASVMVAFWSLEMIAKPR